MRSTTFVRVTLATVAVAGLTVGTALAQSFDKRSFFTFTGPIAVPGVTLPAGQYMIRVANVTQRDVLQVLSPDGTKSYAQFFAIRAERPDSEAVPTPEVRFMETAEGMPTAIKSWWYPSDRGGYEFIYPKRQAQALARGTGQPVLTMEEDVVTPAAPLVLVAPTGEERPFEVAPFIPELPAVTGEIAPQSIPVAELRTELPRTASATPLIWLVGAGLMLGAGALARFRR